MSTNAQVGGLSVPVVVYATLKIAGTRLTITPAEVEITGLGLRVPASKLPAAAAARTVALPALPAGLAYRKIAATSAGLDVTVSGNMKNLKAKNCGGTTE